MLFTSPSRARAGLGLPLLEARSERRPEFSQVDDSSSAFPSGPRLPPEGENNTGGIGGHKTIEVVHGGSEAAECRKSASLYNNKEHSLSSGVGDHHRHPTSRGLAFKDSSSVQVPTETSSLLSANDIDEDKYKRKSALEMLLRWIKTFGPGSRRRTGKVQR